MGPRVDPPDPGSRHSNSSVRTGSPALLRSPPFPAIRLTSAADRIDVTVITLHASGNLRTKYSVHSTELIGTT
ncbi:hypothetical protein GCM10010198_27270 [Nocardia seriolae]|nr:hypothetical protein NSERKGN1266_05730 [Nocardia seriolae]GEM24926.1 hypothetical protein NS2_31650 [Nocardia seriolae NBRC 15557]